MYLFVGPYPYHSSKTYLGTIAQERRMEIIANNLANINTPGFKKDVAVFDGFMVKSSKTYHSQGQFERTDNKLDLALSGPGYFQIETPEGIRYTRNGSFTLSSLGEIVTLEGYPVVGGGVVPQNASDLAVTEDGRIFADGEEIGQFELIEFEDPNVLAKEGNDKYVTKVEGAAGVEAEETTVTQGYIERSNVNPVVEMVSLIDTLRTYEVFQKIVHSFQEADQKSINEVGRLI